MEKGFLNCSPSKMPGKEECRVGTKDVTWKDFGREWKVSKLRGTKLASSSEIVKAARENKRVEGVLALSYFLAWIRSGLGPGLFASLS